MEQIEDRTDRASSIENQASETIQSVGEASDMNKFSTMQRFDRVVSTEMYEHIRISKLSILPGILL